MTRSRQVKSHNHTTFDIRPLGECPSCDDYHERSGVTALQIEDAMIVADSRPNPGQNGLRLLSMLRRVDPERHAQYVEWISQGIALSDAVDNAMGDWPEVTA